MRNEEGLYLDQRKSAEFPVTFTTSFCSRYCQVFGGYNEVKSCCPIHYARSSQVTAKMNGRKINHISYWTSIGFGSRCIGHAIDIHALIVLHVVRCADTEELQTIFERIGVVGYELHSHCFTFIINHTVLLVKAVEVLCQLV